MKQENGFVGPLIVIILLAFFGFMLFRVIPSVQKTSVTVVPSVGQSLASEQDIKTWQAYHNQVFSLKFSYPKDFTITEGNKRPGNETGDLVITNGVVAIQVVGYIGVHGTPLLVAEDIMLGHAKGRKYIIGGVSQPNSIAGITVEVARKTQNISIILYPKNDPRRALTPFELHFFDLFLSTILFVD